MVIETIFFALSQGNEPHFAQTRVIRVFSFSVSSLGGPSGPWVRGLDLPGKRLLGVTTVPDTEAAPEPDPGPGMRSG